MGPPSPPPLFLISLGEVAISGDLGFFPAVFFLLFSAGIFFPCWNPLGGSVRGSWWLHGPFLGGLGGSVQLLLLLGSSPASHKEKFQGGIFMPRVGLDFLSDFFALYSHSFGLFWGFVFFLIIFPPLLFLPPPLFLFLRAGDFPLYFSFLHIDLKIIKKSLNQFFWGGGWKEN